VSINSNKKITHKSAINAVVFGVVQGVGFRPFVYRLAKKLNYKGWVKNIGYGVEIHLEKEGETDFKSFFTRLQKERPPLSQIEHISLKASTPQSLDDFEIRKSSGQGGFVFISPDISVCRFCLKEMMNPRDRRFHYPFINCTDCGPRYTIVKALPYDRKQTTMQNFKMCESCEREYRNPLDRRYHAEPIACPVCGPQIRLLESKKKIEVSGGVEKAIRLIKKGKIVAVKGIGGFHLVCDPWHQGAVRRLRRIKERKRKPFALMARDIRVVEEYVFLNKAEKKELLSPRRPIVLCKKKKDIPQIAPFLDEMGFMLPYTPLHHLLLDGNRLIVATSSNRKDAPIMKDEEEGIGELCDYILTNNRPIQMRADDSVVKVVEGKPLLIRRARGYVPYPQKVPPELCCPQHLIALGGELKDTISIYKNGYIITSQFLGDLDEYQNFKYFEETINHLKKLFEVRPEIIVSDLHPDFHTTRYAERSGLVHLRVQHHFAHVLAPLIEHNVSPQKKVLGVAFDGYGYGDDGLAWGSEFLLCDYSSYQRIAHFKYLPLPGGDLAAKQPWRMAISYLIDSFGSNYPQIEPLKKLSQKKIVAAEEMIKRGLNSPLTSSCGRLFDAVSWILGLSPYEVEFEAEAPMRLESIATPKGKGGYPFSVSGQNFPLQISFTQTIKSILKDIEKRTPLSQVSSKFHNTIVKVIVSVAKRVRENFKEIDTVVLIGGVFLNRRLLSQAERLLCREGFKVLRPIQYSPNDESLSLGQLAYALNWVRKKLAKSL